MSRANFSSADIRGANFVGADLRHANLCNVKADRNTNMRGADLRAAKCGPALAKRVKR